jgi:hypothetical protein
MFSAVLPCGAFSDANSAACADANNASACFTIAGLAPELAAYATSTVAAML